MKILYEDDEIIAVFKEAGLAVQSRSALQMDLESMLLRRLDRGDGRRPELYVVHRIDQPVEGLVLFA
jgi:23S rRNA pseudouridine1911/1915/1917 synthase